jgi:excinuclease ABC subunit C
VRPSVRAAVRVLPGTPGVYRFRDSRRRVLYVGRAAHLRRRVASYWGELSDRRHLRAMVPNITEIEAVECASEHEAAWLERNLLEGRPLPPWNRTPGGQEVVVCIRVDSSARSPGISVLHLPVARTDASSSVRYFGPYLGGARVRLAAAGLHRALPLRYTSDGQSSLLRELGVSRGVDEADREALASSLYAVLAREPGAVAALRVRLAELRDAAAAGQAYEVAGRIQTELAALEWITCQQRAAVLEAQEMKVAGWADGVLVRFDVRAGRLGGWRKYVRSRAQAEPWLAATPPEWHEFAERNATLAARLRSAAIGASAASHVPDMATLRTSETSLARCLLWPSE